MEHIKENWEVDIYVSEDGRRFTNEEECKIWERTRKDYKVIGNIFTMKLKVPIIDYNNIYEQWMLVKSEEERDAIVRKYCKKSQYTYINGSSKGKFSDIKIGDWVSKAFVIEDGETIQEGVYTLSYLINIFSEFIKKVNSFELNK